MFSRSNPALSQIVTLVMILCISPATVGFALATGPGPCCADDAQDMPASNGPCESPCCSGTSCSGLELSIVAVLNHIQPENTASFFSPACEFPRPGCSRTIEHPPETLS